MKKITTVLFAVLLIWTGCEYDDSGLNDRLDGLEDRVEQLEKLCEGFNADIAAMQKIVDALQNNDFVVDVQPIMDNGQTVGYALTFSKSGEVKVYFGKDGADGQNGTDGADGYTPQIGIRQDSDGVYYWTLNGEWLLDENGSRIKATGENGTDGQDGADGQDGVTPQLKIEDGIWYISYNNGTDWIRLGAATAPDGQNGADGRGFFSDVTFDEENVYFTLKDGTEICVPFLKQDLSRMIRSLEYIPNQFFKEYLNEYIEEVPQTDTIQFRVAPKSIVPDLIRNFEIDPQTLQGRLYYFEDNLDSGVRMLDMPVIDVRGDEDTGLLTVVFSGEKIPENVRSAMEVDVNEAIWMSLTATYGISSIESVPIHLICRFNGPQLRFNVTSEERLEQLRKDVMAMAAAGYGPEKIGTAEVKADDRSVWLKFARNIHTLRPCFRQLENVHNISGFGFTVLADSALAGNTSIRNVYMERMDTIGTAALKGCSNLTGVSDIGQWGRASIRYMGPQAFMDCVSLQTILFLGQAPEEIPAEAFRNCTALSYIEGEENVSRIGARAFQGTESLFYSQLNSAEEIGEYAFLESACNMYDFSEKLKKIHQGAFWNIRSSYVELTIYGNSIPQIVDGPIFDTEGEKTIQLLVEPAMVDVYRNDPDWMKEKNILIRSIQ